MRPGPRMPYDGAMRTPLALLCLLLVACGAEPAAPPDAEPVDAPASADVAQDGAAHLDATEDAVAPDAGPCPRGCVAGQVCDGGRCVTPDAGTPDAPAEAAVDVAPEAATHPDVPAPCRSGTIADCCGVTCAPPQNAAAACVSGNCGMGACLAGFADCDESPLNGCEVNLGTNAVHCGRCRRSCLTGQSCGFGSCFGDRADCGPTRTGCGEMCFDTRTDVANCGACGVRCVGGPASTFACVAGACVVRCEPGMGDCDGDPANGCETGVVSNRFHCGACGNACVAPLTCEVTACGCQSGRARCGDACVDTQTNSANCGACGHACSGDRPCVMGVCA